MFSKARWSAALLLLSGISQVHAASFQGLGQLSETDSYSEAFAVSGDGLVVVGTANSALGQEAFRWTSATDMVGLGDSIDSVVFRVAFGVSYDGSLVAGYGSTDTQPFNLKPIRWTADGGMVLADLTGGSLLGSGLGVSADGSAIVGFSSSSSGFEAARWTDPNSPDGLGDLLPDPPFQSQAYATSADGSVVVGFGTVQDPNDPNSATREAFRWTPATDMVGLGDLSGGEFESLAFGVSANGNVIVGQGSSDSGIEAFRWTPATDMAGLGDLSGGDFHSEAQAVSADGRLVVGFGTVADPNDPNSSIPKAFLWDVVGGMRNLEDALTDLGLGDDLVGWQLTAANGVSADGTVIVGAGINPDGDQEAWMAVVPAPPIVRGDMNLDGLVNDQDVNPFLDILLNGPFDPAADMNEDSVVDGRDVDPFLTAISAGSSSVSSSVSVPEPCSALLAALALLSIACFVRR